MTILIRKSVPTIQAKLAENGSPRAVFETTDDRLTFLVTIPVHEGCYESSGTQPKSSERTRISSGTRQKTLDRILELIKKGSKVTAPQIAMELGISTRGVEKNLRILRESGIIKRIGSPTFGGYWEIITEENE